jgi:hypothetical protein
MKVMLCILLLLVIVQGVQAVGIAVNFSANTTSDTTPVTVKSTDLSSGSPTGGAWFFGNDSLSSPTITSITPNTMYRNSTTTFTIVGANFQSGGTIVEFRNESTGLIPTTLTSVSASTIHGTATIPANTTPGLWNIRVSTTDGGENIKLNAVTITNMPPPTVTSITPASENRNTTVSYTIVGTNFKSDQTSVIFRNATGSILNSTVLKTVTATQITGTITIPHTAWLGAYNITISTIDGGSMPSTIQFTVAKLPPTITSINPVLGNRNTTVSYTIYGTYFRPGQTTVVFRNASGSSLNSTVLTSVTTTSIKGTIVIPRTAWIGVYSVNISTIDGGSKPGSVYFTVVQPTITSITPTSGYRNTTVSYTIAGTNFVPGQTTVVFRNASGSILNSTVLTSVGTTSIKGTIVIPRTAWTGVYNVNISTIADGFTPGSVQFTVVQLAPTITSITPTTGYRNSTVSYTIAGTNFVPGQTTVVFRNASGSILNPTVLTSVTTTSIKGTITIPSTAWTGAYNVNVRTLDGGSTPGTGMFLVAQPVPTITSITPASANRNTTVSYTIVGTNFRPGQTTVVFRRASGSILNSTVLTSVTTTSIKGTIVIPSNAWIGAYNVNISTIDGGSTPGTGMFTVAQLPPTITSITPASALRNTTVSYTIVGTNFLPGQTSVVFRNASGSLLNSTVLTGVTATQIKGTITIPRTAWIGAYNVNISTKDGGSTPGTEKFAVIQPTITSITPTSGYWNTTVNFTIAGTNFIPEKTTVDFRNTSGVLASANVISVTATQIKGYIVIPSRPWLGPYSVNISAIDYGSIPSTVQFTVARMPAPTLTSIKPTSGYRNTTVSYSIYGNKFEPPNPGRGLTNVVFRNANGTVLTQKAIINVSPTQFPGTNATGTIAIPRNAKIGAYNINLSTVDGGFAQDTGLYFTVLQREAPTITSITPATGYQNTTVNYSIVGTHFIPGQTSVIFQNTSWKELTPITVTNINDTVITGTIVIPSRPWLGSYRINISTVDGGRATGTGVYFTVAKFPLPVITSVIPSTAYTNTQVNYTITGANFQSGLTKVYLSNASTTKWTTVTSVTSTSITGKAFIQNTTVNKGFWSVNVVTVDGGKVTAANAINFL